METIKVDERKDNYDISGSRYICDICSYNAEERPPEWCPVCGNHRILFRKTLLSAE